MPWNILGEKRWKTSHSMSELENDRRFTRLKEQMRHLPRSLLTTLTFHVCDSEGFALAGGLEQ